MDKDILKQNKLPGCDQFTRPEEIKSLSKYLGHIRKVQEEHTKLDKDNLEIPGTKTGRLPEINSLNDYSESLGIKGEINKLAGEETLYGISGKPLMNLEGNRVGLRTEELLSKLSDRSEGLDIEDKSVELEDTKFNLRDVLGIEALKNSKVNIENNDSQINLDNTRININNHNKIDNLDKSRLDIRVSDNIEELEDYKLGIIDETMPESLRQEKLTLKNDSKVLDLNDTKLNINTGDELLDLSKNLINLANIEEDLKELEEYKDSIDDKFNISELNKYKSKISLEDNINELDNNKLNILDDTKLENLSDTKLNIKVHDEFFKQTLDNTRLDISYDGSIHELPKENLTITTESDKFEKKLPEVKLDIDNNSEDLIELSSYLEELDKPDDPDLRQEKINITDTQDLWRTELPNSKLEILNETELKDLEETRLDISDNLSINQLNSTRLDLTDSREDLKELSEKKLKITSTSDFEFLKDSKIILQDITGDERLEDSKLNIVPDDKLAGIINLEDISETKILSINDDVPNLSNEKINLSNRPEEIGLRQSREDLDILKNDDNIISDNFIPLIDVENEINLSEALDELDIDFSDIKLSDTILNISGEILEQKELSDFSLKLEKTNEIDGLGDSVLDLKIDNKLEALGNVKIDIIDSRENSLSNARLDINKPEDVNLSDIRLNIEDNRENGLSGIRLDLEDTREVSLEDTRIDLKDDRENNLSDIRLDIEDSRETELEDIRLDLTDSREIELGNTRLDIEDLREIKLPETMLEVEDSRENSLEDFIDTITDDRENKLPDSKLKLSDNRKIELPDDKLSLKDDRETELEDTKLKITDSRKNSLENEIISREDSENSSWFDPEVEGNELYDDVIERGDSASEEWFDPEVEGNELYDDVIALDPSRHKQNNSETDNGPDEFDVYDKTQTIYLNNTVDSENKAKFAFSKTLEGDELYYKVLEFAGGKTEWEQKIQSLMSAYLSSSKISPERAEEYENKLDETRKILEVTSNINLYGKDTLQDTKYKLPDFNLGMLNPSAFLRWAAENTIGALPIHGGARELLLNETLALLVLAREKLEQATKSNRDRLPGDDGGLLGDLVSGGVSGAIGKAAGRVASAITGANKVDMSQPINRPKTEKGDPKPTTGWTAANDRVTVKSAGQSGNKSKSLLQKVKSVVSGGGTNNEETYKFASNYLAGEGIKTTIEELCGDGVNKESSVEDFFKLLKQSPYITTPEKFTTTKTGGYQTLTLDSNSFWEVIFEPYAGMLNGNYSYLPALHEINTANAIFHGVGTSYNKWIPFTSFDLQKTKISTKSLGLFDGEIVYPVSMEFLNELRFTIADDQYKSWRTYFERCMEVSVYNSEPHDPEYYTSKTNSTSADKELDLKLTAVDKSHQVIAMYKNLAFRCIIYVMTPQKSTIRKFDLLLVLKDFSEEYSGDIDSGGTDLTVTFSIVGENPPENKVAGQMQYDEKNLEKWEEKSKRVDYSSMANKAVSSVMKIL